MNRLAAGGVAAVVLALVSASSAFAADEDPYLTYMKTSPDFKWVKQDPKKWTARWHRSHHA